MTKKDLERIPRLHRRLARCAKELDELRDMPADVEFDTVTGSRKEIPYDKHVIVIYGTGESRPRKIAELKEREARLLAEIDALEVWIASIEDMTIPGYSSEELSEIGELIRLRYRNNLAWDQVAREYYGGEIHDESYPRRKAERFLRIANKYME